MPPLLPAPPLHPCVVRPTPARALRLRPLRPRHPPHAALRPPDLAPRRPRAGRV